jgi:hypothetical protein
LEILPRGSTLLITLSLSKGNNVEAQIVFVVPESGVCYHTPASADKLAETLGPLDQGMSVLRARAD